MIKPLISSITPAVTDKGLSVYAGQLTLRTVLEQNLEIAKAFPQLPEGFYEALNRRLREKKFTDIRLRDAVNHVIDTCRYPVPTVADFISYDSCVQIFTYSDLVKQLNDDKNAWDYYDQVKVPGIDKPGYARKEDVIKFNLEKWQ